MRFQRSYSSRTRNGPKVQMPSPPGTHGFLYYRPPPPWAHDLAGEIRFRITKDSNPSSFATGRDLFVQGIPWTVALIFNTPTSAAFRDVLLRDGLLTEDQICRLERLEPRHSSLTAKSRLVHSIGQPFALPINTSWNAWKSARYFVPGIMDGRDVLEKFDIISLAGAQWGYGDGTDGAKVFSKDGAYVVLPSDRSKHCSYCAR